MPTSFWYVPSKHPFSVSLYRIAGLVWRIVPVRVAFVFIYLCLHKWQSHISSKDASGSLLSNPSSWRQSRSAQANRAILLWVALTIDIIKSIMDILSIYTHFDGRPKTKRAHRNIYLSNVPRMKQLLSYRLSSILDYPTYWRETELSTPIGFHLPTVFRTGLGAVRVYLAYSLFICI